MEVRSDTAVSPFQSRLRAGETLLWQGKPVPEAYARHHYNPYLLIGVALATCFLVAWEALSLIPTAARFGHEVGVLLMTGLLFAVGYSKVSALLSTGLRARSAQTFYAVTSRRIMVLVRDSVGQFSNYDELHLSDLCLTLKEQPLGLGSIFFGVTTFYFSLAFRGIEEARQVRELIQKAREQQIEAERLRPTSYGRPDVWDKYQEDGEVVVWRGKPCLLQTLVFFVMGCAFATGLISLILTDAPRLLSVPISQATLKSVAVWLCSAFIVGMFWAGASESWNTFYAVTDQRLMRLYRVGKCHRFMEMALGRVRFLSLEWQFLRLGTITFGNQATREFYFRTVWGAPALLNIIRTTRQQGRTQA